MKKINFRCLLFLALLACGCDEATTFIPTDQPTAEQIEAQKSEDKMVADEEAGSR